MTEPVQTTRPRGPSPVRRQPSRRVRLRRTAAGAIVLVLLGLVGAKWLTRDTAAEVADSLPGVMATAVTSPAPEPKSATPHAEDGSTTSEAPKPGAPAVPQNGTGKIAVVSVPKASAAKSGREVRYTVEIEEGLGVDKAKVAKSIQGVLLDSRGWQKVDGIRFVNVTPAEEAKGRQVDIRVTLASPGLTDKLCAPLKTLSQVSCWNGERSVLNFKRWQLGDDSYGKDVERYRLYQVNHEVGHGLGHQHASCPAKGKRAPVMVQQTLDLEGCLPWPFPAGA